MKKEAITEVKVFAILLGLMIVSEITLELFVYRNIV